jgi:uncharacterized protein YuzE
VVGEDRVKVDYDCGVAVLYSRLGDAKVVDTWMVSEGVYVDLGENIGFRQL